MSISLSPSALVAGEGIIHQVLFQRHEGIGVTAVLDLPALAKGHEAVAGAAFPVTGGAEAGDIIHFHKPVHDFVQCAGVDDVKLFGAFVFGFGFAVAAHAGAGASADLGDAQVQCAFPDGLIFSGGDDHAGGRARRCGCRQ